MGTTAEKLSKALESKETIKQAIIQKGVEVLSSDPLSSYADKIKEIADDQSYGVEWDITVDDPHLNRIGNPLLHKLLPVQSQYKGCVVKGQEIQYWLDPNDWSRKLDGTPSKLDGTDGDVKVWIPKFYGKSAEEGNKKWVRISLVQIDATWTEIPEMLIDAYRCTVSGGKTYSVCNTTAEFRGGGNRAGNDQYLDTDPFKSDLGKPRTAVSRATMRGYAKAAGSELMCYEFYKWIFYWNWVIEYATFNSQAPYNAELTVEGYHQGGMGPGLTTMGNWGEYNGYNPLTPCGFSNEMGNGTGIKNLVIPEFTYTINSYNVNQYSKVAANATLTNSNNNGCTASKIINAGEALNNNQNNIFGTTKYKITGLTAGQSVIFKQSNSSVGSWDLDPTILTVTTDGEYEVNWDARGVKGNRKIGFSKIEPSCNISIYIITKPSVDIIKSQQTLQMHRWRGFENIFGDIWTNLEGIVLNRKAAKAASEVYTTSDPTKFDDTKENKTIVGIEIAQDGWIKEFDLGTNAEIIPASVGASPTTHKCDYHYCNVDYTGDRTLLVGGLADHGGAAGLGYFHSSYSVGTSDTDVGFRTLIRLNK